MVLVALKISREEKSREDTKVARVSNANVSKKLARYNVHLNVHKRMFKHKIMF